MKNIEITFKDQEESKGSNITSILFYTDQNCFYNFAVCGVFGEDAIFLGARLTRKEVEAIKRNLDLITIDEGGEE